MKEKYGLYVLDVPLGREDDPDGVVGQLVDKEGYSEDFCGPLNKQFHCRFKGRLDASDMSLLYVFRITSRFSQRQ